MANSATIHRLQVELSDVDRNVYQQLDLRLARHPSETMRYLLTRTLAYCLSYEDGIAFSKGGLATASEPPVAVHDATGLLRAWIDVGSPSAERLHKAAKAAERVLLYTSSDLALLRREVNSRPVHRLADIAVWWLAPAFVDSVAASVKRKTKLEVVRSDGQLYITVAGDMLEGSLKQVSLTPEAAG